MTKIRGTHRYHFRRDQWANLIGMTQVKGRQCYIVQFPDDNFIDYWVVSDVIVGYEFKETN